MATRICLERIYDNAGVANACCKRGVTLFGGIWFCKRHAPPMPATYPRDMLCKYGVNGLCLADIEDTDFEAMAAADPVGVQRIRAQRGHLNMITWGPMFNENYPTVVMAKHLTPPAEHLDHKSIALHIRDTIEHMYTRPDLYDYNFMSFDELRLMDIKYDSKYNIFYTNIQGFAAGFRMQPRATNSIQ